MEFCHFTISQQGDSHIKSGKNCQDYSESISITNQKLNATFGVVAIADGVGSCNYSEFGSKIAVTTVLEVLKKELSLMDDTTDKGILTILKSAYTKANDEIEREAEERELPFKLFDTTLTVTILTESGICYVGHIGDDGVVALMADGTYSMITKRIEGEEANSVIPLSSADCWTFGVVRKPVAALVLLTDGLLDKAVGSERMNNRVYYPFFKSLFENIMETEKDVADLRDTWDGYLREKEFREGYGVTDDITLALIQLPAILKKVKPVPFDEEKWNEDSKKLKKEIEDALSNNTKKRSDGTNEITSPETVPKKETTQATNVSQTMQQATDNAPLHNARNLQENYSEATHTERRVIHSIDNSSQSNSVPKKTLRILIPALSLVLLLGFGFIIRKVGYNAGVIAGKQQEQSSAQEQLNEFQIARENDLKAEYERGFHDAESLHEEELQAEYDRGFHDAELELANNAKDNEDTLQSQTDSPEKYVITRGQKGEIVKDIQTRIISKGWNIKADGIYGAMTEQAVREFQQLNTLRITGDVDILTFWLLVDENSKGTEALSHNATPSPSPTPEVHNNDSTNPDSSTEQNVSELLTVTEPNEEENEGSDKTKISLSTGT